MRLSGIELVRMRVPFRTAIGTAAGVHRTRPLLFARVVTEEAEGWGECVALEGGTSVDPAIDIVHGAAATRGVERLVTATRARGGHVPLEAEVAQLYGSSAVDRQLAALFEMAVADAELRAEGRSLAEALEVVPSVELQPVGTAVGIPADRDRETFEADVARAVAEGATRVRIKIAPGWDVEPVAAARRCHPGLLLMADANGSYVMDDAERLGRALAEWDLVCLEQPLPPADLAAQADFARRCAVPIGLDESLSSPRRVLDALRNESCAVACLKPGRLGGLRATRVAHEACVEAGVPAFVGGFFEAGLGRGGQPGPGGVPGATRRGLVGDLADPSGYLEVDPCGYPQVRRGWVKVPGGVGVGNAPDRAVAERFGADHRWFPAT